VPRERGLADSRAVVRGSLTTTRPAHRDVRAGRPRAGSRRGRGRVTRPPGRGDGARPARAVGDPGNAWRCCRHADGRSHEEVATTPRRGRPHPAVGGRGSASSSSSTRSGGPTCSCTPMARRSCDDGSTPSRGRSTGAVRSASCTSSSPAALTV
jgi:hypothetical protein